MMVMMAMAMRRYKMMSKLGLPEGAIRIKMQTEGIDAADITAFFGS